VKISKLTIKNWKSHVDTTLELGPMTLIRGANNSGKSSVAEAIEFLLTGRCERTGEAGQGGDSLIRVGASEAQVSAVVGDNGELTITRTRNRAGAQVTAKHNNQTYAGKQVDDQFARRGWNREILSAALRLNRFGWLEPKQQKELLADVLRPDDISVPKEILDIMRALAEEIHPTWSGYVGAAMVDLKGARAIEKDAIEARVSCTRALKELGEPAAPPEESKPPSSLEGIRGRLDKLRRDHTQAVTEKLRIENTWTAENVRAMKMPDLMAAEETKILTAETEAQHMKVVENEPKAKKAEEEIAGIQALMAEYNRQLRELTQAQGKCPTCGAETDTSALRGRIGESIRTLTDRLPGLQHVASAGTDIRRSTEVLRVHREAIIRLCELSKEHMALGKREIPDTKELEAKIAELDSRIAKGQEVLAQAAAWQAKSDGYQEANKQILRLKAGQLAADTLAKWMGPSGVQAQMSAGKLGPFMEAINATLEKFGYHCSLEMEPYSIRLRRVGAEQDLELDFLSESEKWRFSLAFQAAIANVTGFKFIVCDCADILVGSNRGSLLKAVLSAGMDQVILLASTDKPGSMPPEITVFDLELSAGRTIAKKGGT